MLATTFLLFTCAVGAIKFFVTKGNVKVMNQDGVFEQVSSFKGMAKIMFGFLRRDSTVSTNAEVSVWSVCQPSLYVSVFYL